MADSDRSKVQEQADDSAQCQLLTDHASQVSFEQQFRAIAESASDAIISIDPAGKIIFWNKAAEMMFGYTRMEAKGMLFTVIVPERLRQAHDDGLKRVVETGVTHLIGRTVETQALRHDSQEFPVELSLSMWHVGPQVFFSGIVRDITDRKIKEQELHKTVEGLKRVLAGTVSALATTTEKKDPYTSGHQKRVAKLAGEIGSAMGLPAEFIDGLHTAGLLHDIGKIAVPSEILSKPSKLNNHEFALIKEHPQIGYEILKDIEFLRPVAIAVLQHHERMDGSGYPQELSGNDIVLEAKILTVADVVEAMSTHRPYRPALGITAALDEIEQRSGAIYDPLVVNACLKVMHDHTFSFD